MKLTEEQKLEIKDYIINVPKYRETYNELYDHILNSLNDIDRPFSTDEIDDIVLKDFGGYQAVYDNEKFYRAKIGRRYMRFFLLEMLNTFKWPEAINNLIVFLFCLLIYFNQINNPFNQKPLLFASIGCCSIVAVFMYTKIILNRMKYNKDSILDNYIQHDGVLGILFVNIILQLFISKESYIKTSDQAKLIITLFLFFFSSIYIRALIKFYKKKLSVLGI